LEDKIATAEWRSRSVAQPEIVELYSHWRKPLLRHLGCWNRRAAQRRARDRHCSMATSSPLPCLIAEWNRRGGLVNDGGHISISSGPQLLSSQHSGGAVVPRAAAEQATSTQQDRATTDSVRCQRRASQALRACLHHSRLFPALDVIAISSPAPLSDTCSRCEPAGRVHLEANCTTSASRQISGSRRQQSAGSYPLRGCLRPLRTPLGRRLGGCFTAGGFRCALQTAAVKRLLSSTQVRCSFAAAH
jgi:hypothetical protein